MINAKAPKLPSTAPRIVVLRFDEGEFPFTAVGVVGAGSPVSIGEPSAAVVVASAATNGNTSLDVIGTD